MKGGIILIILAIILFVASSYNICGTCATLDTPCWTALGICVVGWFYVVVVLRLAAILAFIIGVISIIRSGKKGKRR